MKKALSFLIALTMIFNLNAPLLAAQNTPAVKELQHWVSAAKQQTAFDIEKIRHEAQKNEQTAKQLKLELQAKIDSLTAQNQNIKQQGYPQQYRDQYNANHAEIERLTQDLKILTDNYKTYADKLEEIWQSSKYELFHIPSYLLAFGLAGALEAFRTGFTIGAGKMFLRTLAAYGGAIAAVIGGALLLTSCSDGDKEPYKNFSLKTPGEIKHILFTNPEYLLMIPQEDLHYLATAEQQYPELKTLRVNYMHFLKAIADDSFKPHMDIIVKRFINSPQQYRKAHVFIEQVAQAYVRSWFIINPVEVKTLQERVRAIRVPAK